ncbi:hypothetical protein M422DRAFT_253988 [Sphaerobolus stellatus SS14]|uniref:Uncharacterized protein n=1 Tax=Sphaerobolus stellatus (strain SS14) TaxID=990650 RepID=A0A0C9UIM8_SPHS4|nr:hypothetical protein M422DRAFT_253988 [Sphaerobolus stellatus SS14]
MSAASSSKTTTANTILYKKAKDILCLHTIEMSDPCRTLSGFTKRRDPMGNEEWEGYEKAECEALVQGYWCVYDQEYNELEALYLALVRKEVAELEGKRKSEEENKKKKSKPAAPIASRSGSGKGKEKVVEADDSESKHDLVFRETCVGCERAKSLNDLVVQGMLKKISKTLVNLDVKAGNRNHLEAENLYYRYHQQMLDRLRWSLDQLMKAGELDLSLQTLEHQYHDGSSVSEDLQDGIFCSRARIIDRYNKVALTCGAQMKRLVSRYKLGKTFITNVMLLDRNGDVEFEGDVESEDPGSGDMEMEWVVEKEVGPDPVPMEIDKGKGKEKEVEPEENEEDTMKE